MKVNDTKGAVRLLWYGADPDLKVLPLQAVNIKLIYLFTENYL